MSMIEQLADEYLLECTEIDNRFDEILLDLICKYNDVTKDELKKVITERRHQFILQH